VRLTLRDPSCLFQITTRNTRAAADPSTTVRERLAHCGREVTSPLRRVMSDRRESHFARRPAATPRGRLGLYSVNRRTLSKREASGPVASDEIAGIRPDQMMWVRVAGVGRQLNAAELELILDAIGVFPLGHAEAGGERIRVGAAGVV
jgi:hypothetical protein